MGDPLPDAVDASLVESALLDHVRSINPLCCARGPAAHGVLPQAQQHTLHDADDPQQTYLALLREVAALHDALQPQSRGEEERDDPPPPPPGGDVQHAVLTQRLQDLQRQQAAMEAATPSLVSIAKQAEQRRREREKRAKGKQKTKGGKVQRGSDDMFADATRGAALLETERDNLIRLVCSHYTMRRMCRCSLLDACFLRGPVGVSLCPPGCFLFKTHEQHEAHHVHTNCHTHTLDIVCDVLIASSGCGDAV